LRRIFKTDPYEAGLLVGGEDFEECCQKNWAALLPKPNPDTLPPNYTQRQMREWLDSLSDVKDYLILASRNAMKSSFILIWLRSLHLCCPDARALLVSETTKLSAGFIRKYRSFWEVKPNQETMLQKLFPEYCITPGTGSTLEFESPMAHLDLIQASATSTSMQSVVAGGRAEVLLFDDPISNLSCGTEDQRKKSVDLFDLLQKLREVNGSYSITIGTPWFAEEDLYAVLLKRNKADETKSLAFRVDPILTLKRTAQHKLTPTLLPTLTPEDIESFLLPVRMPWRFVKREISANPTFALSQNFCIFPKESDADLKVTFDEADLRAHLRPIGSFESAFSKSVMSLDRAYSVSKYADFSAICAGRIQVKDQQQICVIADVLMDRFRESELVDACVKKIIEHHPTHFVMERDKGWETLIQSIQRKLMLMGVPSPQFQTKPIPAGGQNIRAKAKRIKILELPLMDGRLWFVSSAVWNDPVLEQFIKYDGITVSNSHRKEDAVDAIALLYESYMPRLLSDIPVESTTADEQKKIDREAEEEVQRQNRVRHYEAMFGSNYQPPPKEPEQLQQQPDPRNKIFGGNGLGITRRT